MCDCLARKLTFALATALGHIVTDSAILLEEDRVLQSDVKLRRKLALVWLHCENLGLAPSTKFAIFVPPLVALGPDYLLGLQQTMLPFLCKSCESEGLISSACVCVCLLTVSC